MAHFAYLGVSTVDQTTEQQLSQIVNAGHQIDQDRCYVEHGVSGKVPAMQREQFVRLNDRLRKGDTLVVTKLDRLGRDTLDVKTTIDALLKREVNIEVLGLGRLDGSPQSNLMLTMLSAISQFERELVSERTKAKLALLKANGVKLGRPAKVNDAELKTKAKVLLESGVSWRKTATQLGLALSTLQRVVK